MVIGGVSGALRGGVAVNINDALHVVRGEERPAGPTNQPAVTDGLMGSEIEASGRWDQTDFLPDDGTVAGRTAGVKGHSGSNHQPSSAVNVPQLPPADGFPSSLSIFNSIQKNFIGTLVNIR